MQMLVHFPQKLYKQVTSGELRLVATSLAFTTVLSFIPFLAVSLAILQKLGGLESLYPKVEKLILSNFSQTAGAEGIHLIKNAISRMMSGKFGTIGGVFLILTSTKLISDMESGINRICALVNKRSFFQRIFFHWFLILALPFILAGYIAMKSFMQLPDSLAYTLSWISIFAIYKFVPATKVPIRSALIGSLAGIGLLLVTHSTFLWVTREVFNYGKLYGSIAALPLLLVWVLVIWYSLLIGAILATSTPRTQK